jgi:lipoprotein NlpD
MTIQAGKDYISGFFRHRKWCLCVGFCLILTACSSGYAPVTDLSINQRRNVEIIRDGQSASATPPGYYRVQRGDTLYSIAFRYGIDYRQLAKKNNINNRYTIYPGQVLAVAASPVSQSKNTSTTVAKAPKANSQPSSSNQQNASKAPSTPKKTPAVSSPSKPKVATNTRVNWRWPATGKVIAGFSGEANKGINLAGKKGDPVYAAAAGNVVYAGSGLHGYGNLVIINHNQEYLSAYAHNSKILVKENENVKVGAKIAEIGNSGSVSTMLHFEIRKDGKPVNPLRYLPKR